MNKKRAITTAKQKIIVNLIAIAAFLFAFEAEAGWKFWEKKEETCESLVTPIISRPLALTLLTKNSKDMDYIKKKCYQLILKEGNYKELYAYYKLYEYADKALKEARKGKDETPNNIYHYMLFYANQNSREFDSKTNSFKSEKGLYEEELKEFEEGMTQEEKIKSFSYIADNLATGTEGWVKKHDYKKSFEYLKRAAEAGDPRSQSKLAECYILGSDWMRQFSILKDSILAYKWTYLSTLHSEQRSWEYDYIKTKRIKTLEQKMTSQEIFRAKQQANLWLNQNYEFIRSNPLKIILMTEKEVLAEKAKTQKFIKDYGLDKPLSNNNINQPNQ